LKAWQPLLTPPWVIGTFLITGAIFLVIGGIIYDASSKVVQIEQRYDNYPGCALNSTCTVLVDVPQDMTPPIYFYYKLTNFYQNHRRYVKSRDDDQLSGASAPGVQSSSNPPPCDPLTKWPTESKTLLYPCGLIAQSLFNDSFQATIVGTGSPLKWTGNGIAWASDREKKFKKRNMSPDETNIGYGGFPIEINEELMVWMRTAGLPDFKKLNKIINDKLYKGERINITVSNVFPVAAFGGTKSVVFSTTTWIGGKNDFLAISYLVVGSVCLVLSLLFLFKHWLCTRQMGEANFKPGQGHA
jgi:hypothetical protein